MGLAGTLTVFVVHNRHMKLVGEKQGSAQRTERRMRGMRRLGLRLIMAVLLAPAAAWSQGGGGGDAALLDMRDAFRRNNTTQLARLLPKRVPVIQVWNKVDAVQPQQAEIATDTAAESVNITVSAKNGQGLETLRRTLLQVAGWQPAAEGVYIARERHVQALRQVSAHLDLASGQLKAKSQALDLLAEELRLAQNDLSAITGEFSSDDLLGVIFSKFCIGK